MGFIQAFKKLILHSKSESNTSLQSILDKLDLLIKQGKFTEEESHFYKAVYLKMPVSPRKVMISPTDACNISCPICWRHNDPDGTAKLLKEEKHLKLDEIELLLSQLKEMGVKVVDFTGGGEPFVRKDILEIASIIKNKGFFGTLTTNGTLITPLIAQNLVEIGLDDICFSIDSPDPAINDRIRGNSVFERTIQGLENLIQAKKMMSKDKPVIRFATVITSQNFQTLPEMVPLAIEYGVCAINFSVLFEWDSNRQFWVQSPFSEVVPYLQEANFRAKKAGIFTNLQSVLFCGLKEHNAPVFCFAPWEMAFINASGEMMVCCTLASLYSNRLGNIRQTSFPELWQGENIQKFRERITSRIYPPECRRCIPEFTLKYNELNKRLWELHRQLI